MTMTMTDTELAFYRALVAPFPDSQLRTVRGKGGGRELTYLDSRALFNRLDEVARPGGWTIAYVATERGQRATLSLWCPRPDGTWGWIAKEDGAGVEEMGMVNKATGEWEPDVDNDEKSGYTNAARRVGAVWGIGRSLYQRGMPCWLDGEAPGRAPIVPAAVAQKALDHARVNPAVGSAAPPPETAPVPPVSSRTAPEPTPTRPQWDNFKIPKAGKGVFAWAKENEKHFSNSIINGMKDFAVEAGWTTTFSEWTQPQVDAICWSAIRYLKSLTNYAGEFDALPDPTPTPGPKPATAAPKAAPPPLVSEKRTLVAAVTALIAQNTGRAATANEIKVALGEIAAECVNGAGHTGEIMTSLRDCADPLLLRNMIAFVKRQVAAAAAAANKPDDDIPF